jgi:hypothetical protein
MNTVWYVIAFMVGGLLIYGATRPEPTPEQVRAEEQKIQEKLQLSVRKILIVDGCNIYRFEDQNRFHYFADCRGTVMGSYPVQSGKTTSLHDEEVVTEQ